MSHTKRTAPVNSGVMGWVYTYHLHKPVGGPKDNPDHPPKATQLFGHTIAYHYTGWAPEDGLDSRLAEEEAGNARAAKLMRHAVAQGVQLDLVDVERGDRNRERQLKIQGGASRRCLLCKALRRLEKARQESYAQAA